MYSLKPARSSSFEIDDEMRALSFYSLGENHEVLFDEPDHDDGGRKLF